MICCRYCGGKEFATTERLLGSAGISVADDGTYQHDGYTTIAWDSSETIGYECRECGKESKTLAGLVYSTTATVEVTLQAMAPEGIINERPEGLRLTYLCEEGRETEVTIKGKAEDVLDFVGEFWGPDVAHDVQLDLPEFPKSEATPEVPA